MSRCVSGHEPLKVQKYDGKSARIFQRNTDQAMAYTRPKFTFSKFKH